VGSSGAPARTLEGRVPLAVDIAVVVLLRLGASLWLRNKGFSHVSDDDYARVVTSQLFAHEPKLDPTGTSWLPFPFWVTGSAMRAFGRSLEVAGVVGFVLGALASVPPHLAALAVGCGRRTVLGAMLFASFIPWNAWLAGSVVPESWTHGLIAAAVLGCGVPRARPLLAIGMLVATLSRYEAWPVALMLAGIAVVDAIRGPEGRRRLAVATAAVAIAGPLAWMAWNLHAHGSATHFAARVAAYRQSLGAAAIPLGDKLTGYPRAVWTLSPMLTIAVAVAVVILVATKRFDRFRWSAACAAGLLAFLVYGDVKDGAPTHHPERALTALVWVFAVLSADGVAAAFAELSRVGRQTRTLFALAVGAALAAWVVTLPGRMLQFPARAADEDRTTQIRRGEELRLQGATAVTLEPCAYEHFALMAGYGAPERVTVLPTRSRPVDATCPVVRDRVP